ncbi:MAG: hypothetical protein AB1468_03695 [Candidatus Micrarchaeota archaeon]
MMQQLSSPKGKSNTSIFDLLHGKQHTFSLLREALKCKNRAERAEQKALKCKKELKFDEARISYRKAEMDFTDAYLLLKKAGSPHAKGMYDKMSGVGGKAAEFGRQLP